MAVQDVMAKHGYRLSASCAGKASYTRFLNYNGKRAYIAVTDMSGEGVPHYMDEPVRVTVYDFRSGEELEPPKDYRTLSAYLETLGDRPE